MKQKLRVFLTLLLCAVASVGWGEEVKYSMTPNQDNTGSTATSYITSLTEFTYEDVSWKMNQWNPSTLQVRTNQSSAASEFRFYNTSAFSGRITKVVITFSALTVSDASKLMFLGGTSEVTSTTGGTAGTWDSTEKTLTWTPGASDNFTYFAFYQNGKAASGSNYLSDKDAIVVSYEGSGSNMEPSNLTLGSSSLSFDLYGNSDAKTITYTTSSTGAVTVSESEFVETSVDAENKTITVTPKKKTSSAQTITVSQAADDTYAAGSATFTVTVDDSTPETGSWVETSLSDLTSDDVFVIVGNDYALPHNNGTDAAPSLVPVTISESIITSTVTDIIKWNVSGNATDGYTFYPYENHERWLYCNTSSNTGNNNNIRVGIGARKVFELTSNNYLKTKDTSTSRYLSIYGTQDWRGYTSADNAPVIKFYKLTDASATSISASNVNLAFNATSGSFNYTITNPIDGTLLTASTEASWISDVTVGTDSPVVTFTVEANTGEERSAIITLAYGELRKEITVTQAAAPVSYTTIPALFEAATNEAKDVNVTFNDWVVSGVSTNGKNVFVTDGTNGFVIFDNNGGLNNTYHVGDILSGTAIPCTLKLNAGYAQLSSIDVNNLTISNGGTISIANIALAELTGVNTGALVSYEGLICSVSTSGNNTFYDLSDGTTTIRAYSSLYSFGTVLEDGKTYNVTGVYQQYNTTKEILPRSAADIEEVVNNDPVISVEATLSLAYDATSGVISYTIDNPRQDVTLSADADADWISNFVVTDDKVTFTTTVNEGSADRTATITLSYTGADDKTVTVTQGHYMAPGEWVLTNLADLTENDVFVIVGTYDVDDSSYAMSNDKGTNAPDAVAVTVVGNTLSGVVGEKLQWNISGNATDGYTFYPNGTTETWLYCTNTNNGVKVGTNENNKTFTVSEEGYLVNAATSRYVGIYDSQDWRCYTSINSNIEGQTFSFYKKVENTPQTVEVTISAAATDGTVNYGTLYCDNMNLSVPEGVKAYTASVSNGKITLSEVQGAIPARTGVLLKTESKLTDNTNFNFTEAAEAGTVSDGNMLHGTVDESGKAYAGEGNWKYYKLTTKNGSNLGFYFGVDGGAAFANGANKAYLAVPADQALARGYVFGDETTSIGQTGIEQMTNKNAAIYNLSGQRVNKAQKGIYIVNGKKVVIK